MRMIWYIVKWTDVIEPTLLCSRPSSVANECGGQVDWSVIHTRFAGSMNCMPIGVDMLTRIIYISINICTMTINEKTSFLCPTHRTLRNRHSSEFAVDTSPAKVSTKHRCSHTAAVAIHSPRDREDTVHSGHTKGVEQSSSQIEISSRAFTEQSATST
jgi:hypothetical protein